MNDAWQQIGDVLAANQRIRSLHLAHRGVVALVRPQPHAARRGNAERAFALTAPVARRLLIGSPTTIAHLQTTSLVPPVSPRRRCAASSGRGARLMRSLPFTPAVTPTTCSRA